LIPTENNSTKRRFEPSASCEIRLDCFNREAVTSQSPGLPCFGGYPGKERTNAPTPTGLRPCDKAQINLARTRKRTQPLRGWKCFSCFSQGSRQSAATQGFEALPLRSSLKFQFTVSNTISGGTQKRTGRILVPIPVVTNK